MRTGQNQKKGTETDRPTDVRTDPSQHRFVPPYHRAAGGNRDEKAVAFTHCGGNSDADDPDAQTPDELRLAGQKICIVRWIAVGDENDGVGDARPVPVTLVEDFCPRQVQSARRIRVFVAIMSTSDSVADRLCVGKIGEIELQIAIVACTRQLLCSEL